MTSIITTQWHKLSRFFFEMFEKDHLSLLKSFLSCRHLSVVSGQSRGTTDTISSPRNVAETRLIRALRSFFSFPDSSHVKLEIGLDGLS